jgi:hypothetical protein
MNEDRQGHSLGERALFKAARDRTKVIESLISSIDAIVIEDTHRLTPEIRKARMAAVANQICSEWKAEIMSAAVPEMEKSIKIRIEEIKKRMAKTFNERLEEAEGEMRKRLKLEKKEAKEKVKA